MRLTVDTNVKPWDLARQLVDQCDEEDLQELISAIDELVEDMDFTREHVRRLAEVLDLEDVDLVWNEREGS